jgi:hypothetical protein
MNWNEYRKDYVKKHGSTSIQELSDNYNKYKSKKSPKKSPKKIQSLNYEKIRSTMPVTRKYKIQQLEKVMKNKNEPRGSTTRGWQASSPQKGTERHELKKRCPDAFLDPEHEKYPVMAALRVNDRCEVSCVGVQSAINRACQYNKLDIAEKAQKLGEQHCGFKHKSPCRNKRMAPGPQ